MQPSIVWLVGDFDDPCFAPAIKWLEGRASVRRFRSPGKAIQALPDPSGAPDCLMICAVRPGRVDGELVGNFLRQEPLTRIIQLLGSWCEGEARSGRPVAGVKRVYWHQWRSQLPLTLGLDAETSPVAHLPRTASESDWLDAVLLKGPNIRRTSTIAVVTHRAATFAALSDALAAGGFQSVWQRPLTPPEVPSAAAFLHDGWPWDTTNWRQYNSLRPPRVLLLDFPRLEDQQRAEALGFFTLVSRPFLLTELWATLDAAIAESEHSPAVQD